MRFNFIPVMLAKTKDSDNTKCWLRLYRARILIVCFWEYKLVTLLWKTIWQYLVKFKICTYCDLALSFLRIYP